MSPRTRGERRRLWIALGVLGAASLSLGTLYDPDLSWHLAAGRFILKIGAIPTRDTFSWTMLDQPWIDFEWGFQLILLALANAGGAAALWLFKSLMLCVLGVVFLALLEAWEFPDSWIGAGLVVFAAAVFPVTTLRPELFSLLFFELELLVLERRRLGKLPLSDLRLLALHAAFYCVWANLHAGFVTGLLLCVCYFVGERLTKPPKRGLFTAGFALAGGLATLINPYGWRIYSVLLDHSRHLPTLRGLIMEWQVPELAMKYLASYWVIVTVSLGGFLYALWGDVPIPSEHLVSAVVFAAASSRSVRTTTYVILIVYPLSLYAWIRARAPRWWRPPLSAGIVAVAVAFIGWQGAEIYVRERAYARPTPMEDLGPARACRFLREEKTVLAGLNMFNPYNWGGYFDYQLSPDYKVFMDGRYIFADLLGEFDAAQKNPDLWRRFLDEEGVDLLLYQNSGLMLVKKGIDLPHPYIAFALPEKEWALVFWDRDVLIYVRREKVPKEWLARREYRWLRPHDLRQVGYYIVAGAATYEQVSAEIDRYAREIGDQRVAAELKRWRGMFLHDMNKVRRAAALAKKRRRLPAGDPGRAS
jgi:hypothetical protein